MFLSRKLACVAAVISTSVALAGPALANGRFPASGQVAVDLNDPNRLWLRGTRGLFTSSDAGCTWHWICEEALGIRGEQDPPIAMTPRGVLAAASGAILLSEDNGCSWNKFTPLERGTLVDLTVEKQDPNRALLIASAYEATTTNYVNQVHRSLDGGRTWTQLGANLDARIFPQTIDAAPSEPTTIYLSGVQLNRDPELPDPGVLLRTTDDGQTWEKITIPNTSGSYVPFLSAVHPTDPKKLYVRVRGPVVNGFADNRLVYSADGGDTWTEILKVNADMLGFALSPNGEKVLVGVGDPGGLEQRGIDKSAMGIYIASSADHQFQRGFGGDIGCLTWSPQGVYACTSQFSQGFEVGLSKDEGVTADPLMYLAGITGPLECAAGTSTAVCTDDPQLWLRVCRDTNRCEENGDLLPLELPNTCPGATSDGSGNDDSSCGCRAIGTSRGAAAAGAGLVAFGLFAMRRRRARHLSRTGTRDAR